MFDLLAVGDDQIHLGGLRHQGQVLHRKIRRGQHHAPGQSVEGDQSPSRRRLAAGQDQDRAPHELRRIVSEGKSGRKLGQADSLGRPYQVRIGARRRQSLAEEGP